MAVEIDPSHDATTGNRCGHSPDRPVFFGAPESHANRPGVLRKLGDKIKDYYYSPRKILPTLDLANGSERQQRSERREGCLRILGCLTHYTELATLRVGIPQADGSFQGLTLPYLADKAGLSLRRAERAIADLVRAGVITVHKRCDRKEDGSYKGYAAVRTVTKALFAVFGLGHWLRHERDKAAERLRKKQRKQTQRKMAQVKVAMNAQANATPDQAIHEKPRDRTASGLSPMADFFSAARSRLKTSPS